MKLVVKLPDAKGKWQIQIGRSVVKRSSAKSVYGRLERYLIRFLASSMKDKTCVCVKDGREVVNESLRSLSAGYLLYCLTCFMENDLGKSMIDRKIKKYKAYADKN